MAKMIKQVTVSFQVTFELPSGVTIPQARERIKEALLLEALLQIPETGAIKVHLLNKEIQYGAKGRS